MAGINIEEILGRVGDNIEAEAKKVLEDNEELFKDWGAEAFKDLMVKLKLRENDEINAIIHEQMLLGLSDEDLLKAKAKNIEALEKISHINKERRRLASELVSKISESTASLIVTAIMYA